MDRYGKNEWLYAYPIANALVTDDRFRHWFVSMTPFKDHAMTARLLWEEQKARRTKGSETWWRSYWTGSSYKHRAECGERETDLLAVFEAFEGFRFALHVEVKAPGDKFGVDQARDYGRRAKCWKGRDRAPKTVLPHDDAATILCCEGMFAHSNPEKSGLFDTVLHHSDIAKFIEPYPHLLAGT